MRNGETEKGRGKGESRGKDGEEVKGRERAVEDNHTYIKSKAKVNCPSST